MKTSTTIRDSRINRNHNVLGYMEICTELVQAQGYDKTFEYDVNYSEMSYNEFKTSSIKQNNKDISIEVVLNFVTNEATITVDTPEKSKLDEEMEIWDARANDEFGQTIKEINEKAFAEYFNEEDEYGIVTTPISWKITSYALDGNRKYTSKAILSILEDYDVLEDVKELVEKMIKLAA